MECPLLGESFRTDSHGTVWDTGIPDECRGCFSEASGFVISRTYSKPGWVIEAEDDGDEFNDGDYGEGVEASGTRTRIWHEVIEAEIGGTDIGYITMRIATHYNCLS